MNGQPLQPNAFQAPEAPAPSRRPSGKVLAIIAIAAVLAIATIIGAIVFVRRRSAEQAFQARLQVAENQLGRAIENCDDDPDPERCKVRKVEEAAAGLGEASVCEALEGDAFDACVWNVARGEGEASICSAILSDERRASCSDDLNSKAEACEEILDEKLREGCLRQRDPVTSANCREKGRGDAECTLLETIDRAISARDPDLCGVLDGDDLETCLEHATLADRDMDGLDEGVEEQYGSDDRNSDTDGDGLSDYEEVFTYRSSPVETDSDGDGFPDGEEVMNGFDPAGPGTL